MRVKVNSRRGNRPRRLIAGSVYAMCVCVSVSDDDWAIAACRPGNHLQFYAAMPFVPSSSRVERERQAIFDASIKFVSKIPLNYVEMYSKIIEKSSLDGTCRLRVGRHFSHYILKIFV
jgi:hypothetical protein